MTARKPPRCIADCVADDIVRVDAGTVHLTSWTLHGARWAVLLDGELREVPRGRVWLGPTTRVLELVRPARQGEAKGEVRDPLHGMPNNAMPGGLPWR